MPALNTLQASKTKRILVYGPPKSGKTELVGGLAEKMKLIWIDGENGKDTLFKLPVEWQKNIDMFSIPDTRAVPMMSESYRLGFTQIGDVLQISIDYQSTVPTSFVITPERLERKDNWRSKYVSKDVRPEDRARWIPMPVKDKDKENK